MGFGKSVAHGPRSSQTQMTTQSYTASDNELNVKSRTFSVGI